MNVCMYECMYVCCMSCMYVSNITYIHTWYIHHTCTLASDYMYWDWWEPSWSGCTTEAVVDEHLFLKTEKFWTRISKRFKRTRIAAGAARHAAVHVWKDKIFFLNQIYKWNVIFFLFSRPVLDSYSYSVNLFWFCVSLLLWLLLVLHCFIILILLLIDLWQVVHDGANDGRRQCTFNIRHNIAIDQTNKTRLAWFRV